jgi:predicted phage-related endonuclease
MKILNIVQGSPEWFLHRSRPDSRNASDAPALFGCNPNMSRSQLLERLATGVEPEIDEYTQALFGKGKANEPALLAYAEKLCGQQLYPIVATSDDGYLQASFDGASLDEDIIFEGKLWNAEKAREVRVYRIPLRDKWQIVQHFAVCEKATKCLYLVGDGTENGTAVLWIPRKWLETDIAMLRAAWAQMDADRAAYVRPERTVVVVPIQIDPLPSVVIESDGNVTLTSNLNIFGERLSRYIASLPPNPSTDQDFADCRASVRLLKEAEARLEGEKQRAIACFESIDEMCREVARLSEICRGTRLQMDKALRINADKVRADIVLSAIAEILAHTQSVNAAMPSGYTIDYSDDFRGRVVLAMKGKSSVESLKAAADKELVAEKIAVNQRADKIRANAQLLADTGREHLFPDRYWLAVEKKLDDLRNELAMRIAKHLEPEQTRLGEKAAWLLVEEAAAEKAVPQISSNAMMERLMDANDAMIARRLRVDRWWDNNCDLCGDEGKTYIRISIMFPRGGDHPSGGDHPYSSVEHCESCFLKHGTKPAIDSNRFQLERLIVEEAPKGEDVPRGSGEMTPEQIDKIAVFLHLRGEDLIWRDSEGIAFSPYLRRYFEELGGDFRKLTSLFNDYYHTTPDVVREYIHGIKTGNWRFYGLSSNDIGAILREPVSFDLSRYDNKKGE